MPPLRVQDPAETLDWSCDYSEELDAVGSPSDTISSSSWDIEGGGSPSPSTAGGTTSGNVTTINLSGLERGVIYQLRNTVVTGQARTLRRSITIRCENL